MASTKFEVSMEIFKFQGEPDVSITLTGKSPAELDTALKSHDDTLNTKADTSAVTAVQQEVAAAREANCLVKLAGPLVTTAANAAMEFDLSQVDMTKVAALFVVFSAGGSGEIKLSANDTVVSSICSNNFYNRCNFHCCPYP